MNDLYEKLYRIIGQLLCHSGKIERISKPVFDQEEESVKFTVWDRNNYGMDLSLPYSSLTKVHDHTLDTLIFDLMRKNGLL